MAVFMLRHLRPCIPFLISSERLQRKYLKHMLRLFGEAKTKVRVQAILFIREMAVTLPGATISMAMKVVIQSIDIQKCGQEDHQATIM